jgi:hypothetical protein
LISLHNFSQKSSYKSKQLINSYTTVKVFHTIIRGYEIDIINFHNHFSLITNPFNDIEISFLSAKSKYLEKLQYRSCIIEYSKSIIKDPLNNIIDEIINKYGENKLLNRKNNHVISHNLVHFILYILSVCIFDKTHEKIINNEILKQIGQLDYIKKIDNVLGGHNLLFVDQIEPEELIIKEIKIDDIDEWIIDDESENVELRNDELRNDENFYNLVVNEINF